MRFNALMLAVALAACGQGAQRPEGGGASAGACGLIGDANAIFGADAQSVGGGALDAIAATCQYASADGRLGGDIVTYTPASLGAVTLDARMAEVLANWDAMTETPLAPVPELGVDARIATDLPGYQTQIAFRRGETLVLISASSGDASISGEALARGMAQAVLSSPPAP